MARMIRIQGRDGSEYAVLPADFERIYRPQGFKALGYEDGSEYEPKESAKEATGREPEPPASVE